MLVYTTNNCLGESLLPNGGCWGSKGSRQDNCGSGVILLKYLLVLTWGSAERLEPWVSEQ